MRDFFHKLFCRHEWNHYVYNIKVHNYSDKLILITISFKDCKKCAKSKLQFIFGNE